MILKILNGYWLWNMIIKWLCLTFFLKFCTIPLVLAFERYWFLLENQILIHRKNISKNYQPSQNINIGENGILDKVLTLWNKLLHFFWRMETKIKLLIYVQTLLKVGKKEFPVVTFFINPSNRINNFTQLIFTLKKFIICNSKEANCHMVLIIAFFHFPFLHFSKCPWKVTCSNSTIKSIKLMNSVSQTSIIVS